VTEALKDLRLEDELHLLYLLTPIAHGLEPNWAEFSTVIILAPFPCHLSCIHCSFCVTQIWENEMTPVQRTIAGLVGVDEGFIHRSSLQTPAYGSRDDKAVKARRLWAALILHRIVREHKWRDIQRVFSGIKIGDLAALQKNAATFARLVTIFVRELNWGLMECMMSDYGDRIEQRVATELLPLMELEGMTPSLARVLYNKGVKDMDQIADLNIDAIMMCIMEARPARTESKKLPSKPKIYIPPVVIDVVNSNHNNINAGTSHTNSASTASSTPSTMENKEEKSFSIASTTLPPPPPPPPTPPAAIPEVVSAAKRSPTSSASSTSTRGHDEAKQREHDQARAQKLKQRASFLRARARSSLANTLDHNNNNNVMTTNVEVIEAGVLAANVKTPYDDIDRLMAQPKPRKPPPPKRNQSHQHESDVAPTALAVTVPVTRGK
jgi:hypothetical protein